MTTLLAFHGDPSIKQKYLDRVRQHRAADEVVQGVARDSYERKGCAIGCTLEAYDHSRYPSELGIPTVLAHLEDRLFELQTHEQSQAWPESVLVAIEPGADLSLVWPRFAVWLLTDVVPSNHGTTVAALYQRVIDGDKVLQLDFHKAAYFADNEWAASTAAARAAASDADADDAAYVVTYAADAAYAARAMCIDKMCTKLIELLEQAPVQEVVSGQS